MASSLANALTLEQPISNLHAKGANQRDYQTMQAMKTITMDLPAVIEEARQVYETEPVAAALMLYEGVIGLDGPEVKSEAHEDWGMSVPTHGENVLRTAFWTLKIMGEDARAGLAPTPTEWDMNISVAQGIVRMMGKPNDPT